MFQNYGRLFLEMKSGLFVYLFISFFPSFFSFGPNIFNLRVVLIPSVKAAWRWGWSFTFVLFWGKECMELYLQTSWRGSWKQEQLYLTTCDRSGEFCIQFSL